MQKDSMVVGRLYVCGMDVRIKGKLADGQDAFSILKAGTPVIPVPGRAGEQSIMADGAVITFKWDSPVWRSLFTEVQDAQ